jgi:hypothetical protein
MQKNRHQKSPAWAPLRSYSVAGLETISIFQSKLILDRRNLGTPVSDIKIGSFKYFQVQILIHVHVRVRVRVHVHVHVHVHVLVHIHVHVNAYVHVVLQ